MTVAEAVLTSFRQEGETMTMAEAIELAWRGVLAVSGPDARKFLQGLVSNDVEKATANRAIYAAFLTPQGKYLFDFCLAERDGVLLLDCEAARLADFLRRLRLYKLRSQVSVDDVSDRYAVVAIYGEGTFKALGLPAEEGSARPVEGGVAFVDPRLAALGGRAIVEREKATAFRADAGLIEGDLAAFEALRVRSGVPDGSRDMEIEKTVLLEAGFDELHGIDWKKGCYMGQELTARTKYRGLVKRRLLPVRFDGPVPAPGTPILQGEQEIGEVRSTADGWAIALLKLSALEPGTALSAGGTVVTPERPDWAAL